MRKIGWITCFILLLGGTFVIFIQELFGQINGLQGWRLLDYMKMVGIVLIGLLIADYKRD